MMKKMKIYHENQKAPEEESMRAAAESLAHFADVDSGRTGEADEDGFTGLQIARLTYLCMGC